MTTAVLIASIFALVSFSACAPRKFNEGAAVKVVGGAPAKGDSPEARTVVAVVSPDFKISCTGTLYANGYVLTAGHCLGALEKGGYANGIYVYFGTQAVKVPGKFDPTDDPSHTLKVEWGVRHPGYSDIGMLTRGAANSPNPSEAYTYPSRTIAGKVTPWPPHDLSIFKIAGTIPAGWRSIPLFTEEIDIAPGDETVTVIGYGCGGSGDLSWGTLRMLESSAVLRGPKEREYKQVLLDSKDKGVCSGDSGGPLLFKRGKNLFNGGVLSRGLWSDGEGQENGGIYGFPGAYAEWIDGWTKTEPCLAYKTPGKATLHGRQQANLEAGVTLRASFLSVDPTKPNASKGLVQVEVQDGAAKGSVGVILSNEIVATCP